MLHAVVWRKTDFGIETVDQHCSYKRHKIIGLTQNISERGSQQNKFGFA